MTTELVIVDDDDDDDDDACIFWYGTDRVWDCLQQPAFFSVSRSSNIASIHKLNLRFPIHFHPAPPLKLW